MHSNLNIFHLLLSVPINTRKITSRAIYLSSNHPKLIIMKSTLNVNISIKARLPILVCFTYHFFYNLHKTYASFPMLTSTRTLHCVNPTRHFPHIICESNVTLVVLNCLIIKQRFDPENGFNL